MRRRFIWIGLATVLSFALLAGCSKNPAELAFDEDESEIRQLIEENMDYITAVGLDDGGAQPASYSFGTFSKIAEPIEPLRFGRKGHFKIESIHIEFQDNGTAIATILGSLDGYFYILAKDSTDTTAWGKLYRKEMQNIVERKVIFKRRKRQIAQAGSHGVGMNGQFGNQGNQYGNHGNGACSGQYAKHGRRWMIHRISGLVAYSPETTITIHSLTLETANGSWTIEDPLNFSADIDSLPTFSRGDTVKVYVALENNSSYEENPGTLVSLRFRTNRAMIRARKLLRDDGQYPDAVAGDGIYSGYWVVRARQGIFHTFVDAIDNGTLFDSQMPYNSRVWGMTYFVKR